MATGQDRYRLLIEGTLKTDKIEADIKAISEKNQVKLRVTIGEKEKQDLWKTISALQEAGNKITKVRLTEGTDKSGIWGIRDATIEYTNALGQAEKRWVGINAEINKVSVRTIDYGKELDRALLSAQKFLEKAKTMADTPAVQAAKGTANAIISAVKQDDINKVRELTREFQINKAALEASKATVRSWAEGLKHAMVQTIEYSLTIGALHTALAQLRQGLQYVVDLNKELVSIQVIQAEGAQTPEEIANLASRYNDLARELGATTIETARGSLEWLRQGKSIAETNELLKSTVMLAKLGNLDTAQSTEYLTAIVNGFNKEASESADIVSKLV